MPDMPGLLLLAKKKPMVEHDEPDGDEAPHSEEDTKRAVVKALFRSFEEKDVDGFLQAFEDLKDLCQGEKDDDEGY